MPARLKSYSCSNCGGVLNVDRDEDVFDCPFCGARFDVMAFHKKDILDEVHELWKRKDFAAAKKKLDIVLPKDSDDYELLCAYALSIANLTSFTNLDEPKKINLGQGAKLCELLEKDERYSSGIGAPYFAKLSEMLPIAREYNELSGKKYTLLKRADEGKAKLDREKHKKMAGLLGGGTLVVLPTGYVFILLATIASPWVFLGLLILLVGGGIFANSRYEKIEAEYQINMNPYYELRKKARELNDKMEPLEESYKNVFKELEGLRPKTSDIKQATKEYKPQSDSIVRTSELKNVTCSKCGGDMILDRSRKLYVCRYCGIAYGYSLFFGDVKQKAYEFLKESDFAEADKRFLQVLANCPDDPDAIRGRILCAGRWRAFGEMKVTDMLTEEQLKDLRARIDEAKEHFTGTDQFYPGKISMAVNYLKQYGDVPDGNDEEKSAAAEDFNSALRDLIDADREFRTRQINS
ncbi:MAG: hypothetical protein IJL19_10005 [Clostridiales bacterium]|nr:hypothetical protein [Clostridiales bacterium]